MDIAGKVALVTGGASGIGKAVVDVLLQKQAKVVCLLDVDEIASKKVQEELHEKYGNGKVRIYRCDVSSLEQMEACFKEVKSTYGELHIVCNIAGIMDEINWQRMIEINVNGVAIGTKLAVKYMDGKSSGGGVIVNTSSQFGVTLGPFAPMYSTSKYAVIGLSRTIASFDPEVLRKNIRVNVLCPGGVDTPLFRSGFVAEYQKAFKDLQKNFAPIHPLELAKYFPMLIEEPRNGETLLVLNAETTEFVEDHTRTLRQKLGTDDTFTEAAKAEAK